MILITIRKENTHEIRKLLKEHKFQFYNDEWHKKVSEAMLNHTLELIRPERKEIYVKLTSVYHDNTMRITLGPDNFKEKTNYYAVFQRDVMNSYGVDL